MKMLGSFAKDLLSGEEGSGKQEASMNNIMNDFQQFMGDAEGNSEMKTALD
jgi:hypothetical protein